MPTFEFKNAQELARVFARHGVRYLFFGKSGAILFGFSDTTQDVDLYVQKESGNAEKLAAALLELSFSTHRKRDSSRRRAARRRSE
jgi:predicted nucleotidyltransferase